jgi:hypothetical protein
MSRATEAFSNLAELQLNGTLMTWQETEELVLAIPSLRLVEMGYNGLKYLSPFPTPDNPRVQVVNLDSNELHDWTHVCEIFKPYLTYVENFLRCCAYDHFSQLGTPYPIIKPITHHPIYC